MDEKITITEQFATAGGKVFIAGFCTSDATKPTENIAVGSYLMDASTQEVSFFNGTSWG